MEFLARFSYAEECMHFIFDHWKYIIRNLWFVLPFALIPAIFLALSVDFEGIATLADGFFHGDFSFTFLDIFRAWSLFRFDSVLGIVYSILAFISLVIFTTFLLSFVEKHMRIGKRTFSGVFSPLLSRIVSVFGIALLYTVLYEVWALVLSAVLFAISAIVVKGFACFMFVFVSLVFIIALLYLATMFYLWLPAMQITGAGAYQSLVYSYQMLVGVRWKIIFSMLVVYLPCLLLQVGSAFTPDWLSPIIAFVLFVFAYLSFCIRMLTVYYEIDKLDREDLLHSYREL